MSTKYVLALDQGTTSSRAILFDNEQNIIAVQQREFEQIYPQQGWVEHNPMEIWSTQYGVMNEVVAQSGVDVHDIAAIGITNQRETTILWEKATGRPIYNAIVWQCRRTAPLVDELVQRPGMTEYIRENTGLMPDAYFSATKIKWILDNVPGARERRLTEALTAVRDRTLALLTRPEHTARENLAAAEAFASPEPLDPQWPELLRRVAALPVCPPPRLTQTQQMCLVQAIVWRHGMDALDDRDVVFPVRYAAAALRLLDCLAAVSGRTDAQLVVCVMRETENDPEALPRLRAGLQNTAKL